MKSRIFLALLTFALPLHPLYPQPTAKPTLPATAPGRVVASYLAAFNTGDETRMRAFFEQTMAPQVLTGMPIEQRLQRYRQLKEAAGTLELHSVLNSNDSTLRAVVHTGKGDWLECTFECEPDKPNRLLRIVLNEIENPEEAAIQPVANDEELIAETGAFLARLSQNDEFSGVVLAARNDSILFTQAYGYADREKKLPNRVDTRFNVGSINKSFTRVAILQLEAKGKLSLTDPIGKFLPDYPNSEAARLVTIEHLLTMSSGVGDFFGDRYADADKEKILTLKDYLPLFAEKPLEFAPGSGRRYSNGGYIVLGLIIERVSGIDYYAYVRENILRPAGMLASDWFAKTEDVPNLAKGYTGKGRSWNYGSLPGKGSSAGGGYSTAEDLWRYVQAFQNGTLHLPDLARGMAIAGGAPGLNAMLEWDRGTGYVIAVLSNLDPPAAERVVKRISRLRPRR